MKAIAALVIASACFYSTGGKPAPSVAQPLPGQPTVADPEQGQPAPYEHAPTMLSHVGQPTTTSNGAAMSTGPLPIAWLLDKNLDGSCHAWQTSGCGRDACDQPYACLDGVALPATIVADGSACAVQCGAPPCLAVKCPAAL